MSGSCAGILKQGGRTVLGCAGRACACVWVCVGAVWVRHTGCRHLKGHCVARGCTRRAVGFECACGGRIRLVLCCVVVLLAGVEPAGVLLGTSGPGLSPALCLGMQRCCVCSIVLLRIVGRRMAVTR